METALKSVCVCLRERERERERTWQWSIWNTQFEICKILKNINKDWKEGMKGIKSKRVWMESKEESEKIGRKEGEREVDFLIWKLEKVIHKEMLHKRIQFFPFLLVDGLPNDQQLTAFWLTYFAWYPHAMQPTTCYWCAHLYAIHLNINVIMQPLFHYWWDC